MLRHSFAVASVFAALSLCTLAQQAEAYGFGGGHFSGLGVGIGGLYRSLDFPTERRVPYFAARPPVYYSVPVPRTYGYSPFAYGPWERTPEVVPAVEPVTIENPHVEASAEKMPTSRGAKRADRSVSSTTAQVVVSESGPLTIDNPFVTPQQGSVEYH